MNYDDCKRLRFNPRRNPRTGYIITLDEYNELERECSEIEKKKLEEVGFYERFLLYESDGLFHYKAYPITVISYLLYLQNKYNTCDVTFDNDVYLIRYNSETKSLIIQDENISKCENIMIGILYIYDVSKDKYHANAIIINKIMKTIERFEPHGTIRTWYDNDDLNIKLDEYARENNMTYTNIHNICISLQQIEDVFPDIRGSCSLWSFWYIEYRLRHPNLTKEDIENDFKILYSNDNLLLHKMIVYLGKNITDTKMLLYKRIIKDGDMNMSYIRVLYEMYKSINIENKHILSDIINELESNIPLSEISYYVNEYLNL